MTETEQFLQDKLKGFYYCRLDNNGKDVIVPFYLSKKMIGKQFVKEVFEPVPNYKTWIAVKEELIKLRHERLRGKK